MKQVIPYIQRDISWLLFNYRVLQEAKDPNVPLLERVKFLAIFSSNLDEFFRVRVANHRNLVRAGKRAQKDLDFESREVLIQILKMVKKHQEEFSHIFENAIIPALSKAKIYYKSINELTEDQLEFIQDYFASTLQPFVQPIVLIGKKIKPFLNNAAIYLALELKDKEETGVENIFALLKVPSDETPRFVSLPSKSPHGHDLILLDDIIRHCAPALFPGFDLSKAYSIKLTRDAELYIDDEFSGDLIAKVRKSLNKRKVGMASRLVYDREMPHHFLNYLMNLFELDNFDLSPEGRQHNNSDFFSFPRFNLTNLEDKKLAPLQYLEMEKSKNVLDAISKKDHLIHLPYQSFESVIRFFEDAAEDPNVTHLKIVQYRVAKVSRIMKALMKAVKNGKQVFAFIEIKARFDEKANLEWGEKLEEAGVIVKYSMPGLKVHSKIALVRRVEKGEPKFYTFLSTGNFHEGTAKLYSDVGLFTARTELTSEAISLFNFLETRVPPVQEFQHLGVGQFNLNTMLMDLINKEIDNAKEGKPAGITIKLNSIQDQEMIEKLYEASNAGVKIKMIVRGICSVVPGIKKISENIEVISIVDRFLEHARILVFKNDGDKKVYISSADWMVRNLHHRIETMVPIVDTDAKKVILDILKLQWQDNVKARIVSNKAMNTYRQINKDELAVRSQLESYYYFKRKSELDAWL